MEVKKKAIRWCPQHGYPEPCAKCYGMTTEEWDRFYKSLAAEINKEDKMITMAFLLEDPELCPSCGAHYRNWREVFGDEPCCEYEKRKRDWGKTVVREDDGEQ